MSLEMMEELLKHTSDERLRWEIIKAIFTSLGHLSRKAKVEHLGLGAEPIQGVPIHTIVVHRPHGSNLTVEGEVKELPQPEDQE